MTRGVDPDVRAPRLHRGLDDRLYEPPRFILRGDLVVEVPDDNRRPLVPIVPEDRLLTFEVTVVPHRSTIVLSVAPRDWPPPLEEDEVYVWKFTIGVL